MRRANPAEQRLLQTDQHKQYHQTKIRQQNEDKFKIDVSHTHSLLSKYAALVDLDGTGWRGGGVKDSESDSSGEGPARTGLLGGRALFAASGSAVHGICDAWRCWAVANQNHP